MQKPPKGFCSELSQEKKVKGFGQKKYMWELLANRMFMVKSFTSNSLWLYIYPHMTISSLVLTPQGLYLVRNIHKPAKFQL